MKHIRDLTAKQLGVIQKRCLKEYTTYITHSFGREEKEDVWKKAFSNGMRVGLEYADKIVPKKNPLTCRFGYEKLSANEQTNAGG